MSSPAPTAEATPPESSTHGTAGEHHDLLGFGYGQELHRGVGFYASFAAGFSFVSILTTVFQLFGLGFAFGGAAFFWTWPLVFAGQLLVALCFAELAARYPISGSIFQWSSRLAGTAFGWFTGWVMVIGQTLTVAAAAIALQAVLPAIWDGFQVIGGPGADSSPTSATGAQNAVALGVVLLVVTTVVNCIGVRLMAVITAAGVTIEILGVIALVVALFVRHQRGPGVILTTQGFDPATGSYLPAFIISSVMAAYVMVGFDSAGELAEETHAPRHTTPRTILRALITSGIGGALLIVAGLVAAPSLTDGSLATGGFASILTAALGGVTGRVLLAAVAVAVVVCTLAVQTAGSRMLYSMARERTLPFHRFLGAVSPRTGTPIGTTVVVGVAAALALAVNWNESGVFLALSSLCIGMIYLAYLGVTVPLLVRRLRGGLPSGVDEFGKPLFSLGRWGVPVNAVAIVFQLFMVVNLLWPRASIYDPAGQGWWLQWSGGLVVAGALVVGAVVHWRNRVRHGGEVVLGALHHSAAAPHTEEPAAA